MLELAFGLSAAAHIAVGEDVPFAREELRGAERAAIVVNAVGRHRVRGALHPNRIRLRTVFRRVNGDEEMDSVAHRRHIFTLRVIRLDVIPELFSLAALLVNYLAILGSERSS